MTTRQEIIDLVQRQVEPTDARDRIIERNPAYWNGQDARSRYCTELLNDDARLDALISLINRVQSAVTEYRAATAKINSIIDYPFPNSSYVAQLARVISLVLPFPVKSK